MKKILKVLATLSITSFLIACNGGGVQSSITSSSSASSTLSSEVTYKENKDFEYAKTTYEVGGEVKNLNMQTLFTNTDDPHLDPMEEQHVLVVPFGFTDDNLQNVQSEDNIERIRTTFFGTQEEISAVGGWTSVADYYSTSSFGISEFKGDVVPTWVNYGKTSQQFMTDSNGNLGVYAAEFSRNWYIAEYAKESHGSLGADAKPLSYFDQNGDGYIDLIWIVYSHPTGTTDDWWAYVTYTGNQSSTRNPAVKTLGFASIQWMMDSAGGHDPHTYIHETGHTYGLFDYYDYRGHWAPMAGIDMMDHNLGDHSAFSKFTLGWLKPLVVDDSAVITLRPTTTTGDCFIIPSPNYNGTAFDEYMMVELMAPVGLAQQDYKNGYNGSNGYSRAGIRITHVDARVFSNDHDTYLSENPQDGRDFRVCNSYGGRVRPGDNNLKVDTDYWQREDGSINYYTLSSIMEATVNEKNWTNVGTYTATNDALFTKGDVFNLKPSYGWAEAFMPSGSNLWNKAKTITGWTNSTTQEYTIDENCIFDYEIKVLSIDKTSDSYEAKVRITKLA